MIFCCNDNVNVNNSEQNVNKNESDGFLPSLAFEMVAKMRKSGVSSTKENMKNEMITEIPLTLCTLCITKELLFDIGNCLFLSKSRCAVSCKWLVLLRLSRN